MGMSAVRADPVGSSAIVYNPAGMSRSYLYAAELVYVRAAPGDMNVTGMNVVDSKTQPQRAVGMSYGFHFTDKKAELQQNGHDGRIGFSHSAVAEKLHMGLSLRYLQIERKTAGLEVDDLEGFTVDAGILLSLSPSVHIGLVGQNMIDLKDATVPRRFGGGISYTGGAMSLDADVMMDLDQHADGPKPVIALGLEALLAESIPVRGGFIHDQAQSQDWLSGGIGFMTGEGKNGGQLSISYRHNLTTSESYGFALGLTIFI
jgi:hypothetical protein